MKKLLFLLATSAVLSSALAHTRAQASTLLINDTFESYTIGSAPTTPGDGNDSPWTAFGDLTPTILEGSSPQGAAPNSKVLHLQGEAEMANRGAFSRNFTLLEGSAERADTFSISFKLMIGSMSQSDYRINLQDSTLQTDNAFASIRIASNGAVFALTRTTGPGTGGATNATNPLGTRLSEGVWYEFTIDVNFQAQTYNVTIIDLANPNKSGSTGDLFFYRNLRTLDQIRIHPVDATTASTAIDWYLDDFHAVTSIPEPGSIASLALGGFMMAAALRFVRKR